MVIVQQHPVTLELHQHSPVSHTRRVLQHYRAPDRFDFENAIVGDPRMSLVPQLSQLFIQYTTTREEILIDETEEEVVVVRVERIQELRSLDSSR